MRQTYSTYGSVLWPVFKRKCAGRSETDFCSYADATLTYIVNGGVKLPGVNVGTIAYYFLQEYYSLFLWKYRRIQHYFLAPGVADFCIGSVRELSSEYCKRLPDCPAVDPPAVKFFPEIAGSDSLGGFALHFPSSENRRSLIVIPGFRDSVNKYYFGVSNGKNNMPVFEGKQPEDFDDDDCAEDKNELVKLIFGLSLYMDAFPDTVVEAKDDGIRKINHYSGTRNVVARNEIVDEEHRNGRIPHWRIGHWRLLSSPRFVRKRGQTVYVKGAFVKGIAFEVKDDAPAQAGAGKGE